MTGQSRLTCEHCGKALNPGEALLVTPTDPSRPPFTIHRPSVDWRCFRGGVGPASRESIAFYDEAAARALGQVPTDQAAKP